MLPDAVRGVGHLDVVDGLYKVPDAAQLALHVLKLIIDSLQPIVLLDGSVLSTVKNGGPSRRVDAPGRANAGEKLLTLVASALAGGGGIDDADALRAGRTQQVLGCTVKAPSTLGTFLRSFRWGHGRHLGRVSRGYRRQPGCG